MKVAKARPRASVIDVLDRVLDKGIVIDAWVRVSLIGIDLIDVKARVVVASISTYVRFSDAVNHTALAAQPHEPAPRPPQPAAPAPRAVARPQPRRGGRRRRRLVPVLTLVRCDVGCTFNGHPGVVRCPYHARRRCTLAAA